METTGHFGNWVGVALWIVLYGVFILFLPFYKKSQRKSICRIRDVHLVVARRFHDGNRSRVGARGISPCREGELERARRWGAELAQALV